MLTRAQVAGGGGDILAVVILLDHCSNPAFLQAGFLCTLPHCLIAERPVYSNTIGSAISHISEFTSGAKVLTKEIEKCIPQFKDVKFMSPFACVVLAMPAASNNGKPILSRSETAIYINDIEMINKYMIQFDILNALIDTALDDCIKRTITYLNAPRIAHILNKQNQKKSESGDNIRKALSRMKDSLKQFGISPEEILIHVHSFGYRINTQNTAIKMEMSH